MSTPEKPDYDPARDGGETPSAQRDFLSFQAARCATLFTATVAYNHFSPDATGPNQTPFGD